MFFTENHIACQLYIYFLILEEIIVMGYSGCSIYHPCVRHDMHRRSLPSTFVNFELLGLPNDYFLEFLFP